MTVRMFGYDVEITAGFFLTVVLFAVMGNGQPDLASILLLLVVLFVSVLFHEFGHALAFRAFGVQSSIRLHFMGGATIPNVVLPLSRPKLVFVSFAGPLAGFVLAAVCFGLTQLNIVTHPGFSLLVRYLLAANIVWSGFNLIPVLPLDGGHILEHTLGPKRFRITLGISALVGTALAIYFATSGMFFATYIFGTSAFQAFTHLRNVTTAVRAAPSAAAQTAARDLDEGSVKVLREASAALLEEDFDKAISLAGQVLERAKSGSRAAAEASNVQAWALLGKGDLDAAAEIVARLSRANAADPALMGAVALARGDFQTAKNVLEAARFSGDRRKEVFGPLIQALLGLGDAARAAALALDCFDGLNTEDARTIAELSAKAGQHHWSAKLYEAAFKRDRDPEDAFNAARMFARAADQRRAVDLIKIAVGAGFADVKRVYADEALVGIDELEHVLPRES